MASSEVINLRPEGHSIPKAAAGSEQACILLACITPLALAHIILTDPYLSPAATYTLLSARTTSCNWYAPLASLMRWLRAFLYQTCPGVKYLPPLNMADHITVRRQNLQRQLVPRIPAGTATPAPTYIVHQEKQVSQAATAKEKIQAERSDLQASSLYKLANAQGPEELPEIWHTLDPLTKEKSRPAFEIACGESSRALRCKAPRVTHTVAVLLLGLHFFTEYPDCVNNTVNIFQFPDLSLSAGSEVSMVTRRLDTALDCNTMTSSADAAALIKQQRIPPIFG